MSLKRLEIWFKDNEASSSLIDLSNDFSNLLPDGVDFYSDIWDVLSWTRKIGNSKYKNIYFDEIENEDLRIASKVWILHGRRTRNISSLAGFNNRLSVMKVLSKVMGARSLKTLSTNEFMQAEKWIAKKYKAPFRLAVTLQQAGIWLSKNFGLRINYKNSLPNPVVHGKYGTEAGRADKLIPDEVIRDLLAARHIEDLSLKDKFFLCVFTIAVATGFRVGELATLPADCCIKLNGSLHILHFPEKSGKSVPRPIHPMLAEMVEDAIRYILDQTADARELARRLREENLLNWKAIIREPEAFEYFVENWLHEWTTDPDHLMINPQGAWLKKQNRFVDAIKIYKENANSQAKAAQKLGVTRQCFRDLLSIQTAAQRGELGSARRSLRKDGEISGWGTDDRVVTMNKLEKYIGITLKQEVSSIKELVTRAQLLQLTGQVFPKPKRNDEIEKGYKKEVSPLLMDTQGKPILYQDRALLIIKKYALSEKLKTKSTEFTSISDSQIIRWFSGEARSKDSGNHEDSVFSRLKIINPKSSQVAKFTSHDIRHWLNTIYQNGGLTEDQIALVFNRKYKQQNATYDQTPNNVRIGRLREGIRDKMVIGDSAENYHRIAEFSRGDAESYLEAITRMINPMPHGMCTLDWSTTPCPHHLSCFSCDDEKPCEHLVVDKNNQETLSEMNRMHREAELIVLAVESQGVDSSPTIDHHKRIIRNIDKTIDQINKNRA